MAELTITEVKAIVDDWRAQTDPADAWCFANTMAEVIDQLVVLVPPDTKITVES